VEGASEGLPTGRSQQSFGKAEILRGREAFREVLTKGRRFQGAHICCYLLRVSSERRKAVPIQVGFAVSRGIRSAVKRNRLRRLMREAYRLNRSDVTKLAFEQEGCSKIVFLCRKNKGKNISELKLKDIYSDVQRTLATALTLE
jgi:ribonuclease P protein component